MPEVWIPGSKVPFRPVNPWGRPMPKLVRQVRAPLYQVIVKRQGRGQIPFGPKMEKAFADEFLHAIEGQIRAGNEKELSDPHIVLCVE